MKTLSLLRHADSDWGEKGSKDIDRVLSPLGQEQCLQVAAYLKSQEHTFDRVLCSSAKRASETCERVDDALKAKWAVTYDEALYLCNSKRLIEEIQQVNDDCEHLLVIGHNPTFQESCWLLSGRSDSGLMTEIERDFPPATLTTHHFLSDHWADVGKGSGLLSSVFKPTNA